jgi:hypothetical protein
MREKKPPEPQQDTHTQKKYNRSKREKEERAPIFL